ncbi:uncharacterized protein UV8b_02831 [Ustilaginoidea virens]|uniref:Uncharacterized protein n=1 Tax=Ustilaginoidea virens TaxID=1159556 RepID=A0A8E5HN87_USTVR|nr:uncharacterized protein UV8b_02831 [Ustilaginoidea virens]QUC18590.1 hypothetical protein UV8b_02831 [Ustilaginoidea virens]
MGFWPGSFRRCSASRQCQESGVGVGVGVDVVVVFEVSVCAFDLVTILVFLGEIRDDGGNGIMPHPYHHG